MSEGQRGVNNLVNPSPLAVEGKGEGLAVNNQFITPPQPSPSVEGVLANSLRTQSEGNRLNPESQLSQHLPQNLPPQPNTDVILGLINLISQVKPNKTKSIQPTALVRPKCLIHQYK